MKEDTPTGLTPRKRVWQYADKWELTQSRDTVLQAWRQRSSSNAGGDIFMDENLPPQAQNTEDNEGEGDAEAMTVDAVVSSLEQHQSDEPDVLAAESPVAVSLASSQLPPSKKMMIEMKSAIPTLGTLTDRPTNVITYHASRKGQ
jgi:kinesin family member 11